MQPLTVLYLDTEVQNADRRDLINSINALRANKEKVEFVIDHCSSSRIVIEKLKLNRYDVLIVVDDKSEESSARCIQATMEAFHTAAMSFSPKNMCFFHITRDYSRNTYHSVYNYDAFLPQPTKLKVFGTNASQPRFLSWCVRTEAGFWSALLCALGDGYNDVVMLETSSSYNNPPLAVPTATAATAYSICSADEENSLSSEKRPIDDDTLSREIPQNKKRGVSTARVFLSSNNNKNGNNHRSRTGKSTDLLPLCDGKLYQACENKEVDLNRERAMAEAASDELSAVAALLHSLPVHIDRMHPSQSVYIQNERALPCCYENFPHQQQQEQQQHEHETEEEEANMLKNLQDQEALVEMLDSAAEEAFSAAADHIAESWSLSTPRTS